jgi:emfourin
MNSNANTVTRKKRSRVRGAVFLLGVFVLAGVTSSGSWVHAETSSEPMHICSEIVYQGYVGVSKIVKADSETLSKQEALHLDGLLQTAQFFSLPGVVSSPKFDGCCDRGFPDFRITVEIAKKRHTVTINSQNVISPQELMPLLRWLETRAETPRGAQGRSTHERCLH